jgi:hypothetical protein
VASRGAGRDDKEAPTMRDRQPARWRSTARVHLLLGGALAVMASLALVACDSGEDAATQRGTVTLQAEQGVNFATGEVLTPGNFQNSDLFVTANGGSFRMSPGGPSPTKVRDTSWIKSGGGVLLTFESLAAVPEALPTPGAGSPLPQAKEHIGFVVQDMRGGYAKGWVERLSADSITVQYAPVVVSTP